jgi:hypothetical protein
MEATHPNARLGEFGFNLAGVATDYTGGGFNPAGWALTANDTLQGSGNMSFLFTAGDPPGPANNVTNSQNLTFTLTKNTGVFAVTDFTLAPDSCSNDVVLGCGQLGAHIQSLNLNGGATSDSGVALGDYVPGDDVTPIPEPSSLLLFGTGLAFVARRLRKR